MWYGRCVDFVLPFCVFWGAGLGVGELWRVVVAD